VSNELLEQVLQRHDPDQLPGRVAHDGQVTAPAQHLEQEVVAPRGDRRVRDRAEPNVGAVGVLEDVERVDHPNDIVERLTVDRYSAVARLRDAERELRTTNPLLDGEYF